MSKRFTDTDKWKKQSFRELKPKLKLAWFYVQDMCDSAGMWTEDFEIMSAFIGEKISKKEFFEAFEGEIISTKCGWLVASFVTIQCGELKPNCPPHRNVIKLVDKYCTLLGVKKETYTHVDVSLLVSLLGRQQEEDNTRPDKEEDYTIQDKSGNYSQINREPTFLEIVAGTPHRLKESPIAQCGEMAE